MQVNAETAQTVANGLTTKIGAGEGGRTVRGSSPQQRDQGRGSALNRGFARHLTSTKPGRGGRKRAHYTTTGTNCTQNGHQDQASACRHHRPN